MSQNTFTINPIFFMPIDFEDNSKMQEEEKSQDNYSSLENDSLSSINECEETNDKNTIIFSSNKDDPNIKSMTNSSKIYISEIFKRNWKLKSKRLISKLKKKLIKQIKTNHKYNNYESNNEKNNLSNQIIIKSKKNNNFDFNNYNKNNNAYNQNRINNINYNDDLNNKIDIFKNLNVNSNYNHSKYNNNLKMFNDNYTINNNYLLQSLVHYIKNGF